MGSTFSSTNSTHFKFTETSLKALSCPNGKDKIYFYDTSVPGLCVSVSKKRTLTFCVYKKVDGKPERIKLGRHPDLSVENARIKAKVTIAAIAMGINPLKQQKEKQAKQKSLQEVFNDYLSARTNLAELTKLDYTRALNAGLGDWLNKPFLEITKDKIRKRHQELGLKSQVRANITMRVLRALFNYAKSNYEDAQGRSLVIENPVAILSNNNAWFRVHRRDSWITPHQMPAWYNAVIQIPLHMNNRSNAESVRDYLLLMLLTGLRSTEARLLKWDHVDLNNATIRIPLTKNHVVHHLPLSDYLQHMLKARQASATHSFVFPGSNPNGPLVEIRKVLKKIKEISGISATPHDLRRTFSTHAEMLDISTYAIKYLLNHKQSHDVTRGYIIMNAERVREPMQRITNAILKLCEEG